MKRAVGSNQYQTRLVPDDRVEKHRKARESMPSRPRSVTRGDWRDGVDEEKWDRVVDLSDELSERTERSLRLVGF